MSATVVAFGDCNACDPCGSGSGPGGGSGGGDTVAVNCCPSPVKKHLNVTFQDLGTATGMAPGIPAGTWGLDWLFADGGDRQWNWDGTGPIPGLARCVPPQPASLFATFYCLWLVWPPPAGQPTQYGNGSSCSYNVFIPNGGPWVAVHFYCRDNGEAADPRYTWELDQIFYYAVEADLGGGYHVVGHSFLGPGLFNPVTGAPLGTPTLVSCAPFLWEWELTSLDGTQHVIITVSE